MMEKEIINYTEGVKRFSGHEELYQKYLKKFVDGKEYSDFSSAMQQGRYDDAFRAAHTLKGITGNLSFDRFYDKLYNIVEMLRDGKDMSGAVTYFREVQSEFDVLLSELKTRLNC